ncbi:hypothetical protein GXW82_43185 [Streptacidiphilus sp. 4-A2]|nr:hypothetical protein [Streptacidiphilus sp. 4-A2]
MREGNGWRLNGRIAWLTGWSLVDVVMVGAVTPDDEVLFVMLPCKEEGGLTKIQDHRLWSMDATSTVAVGLHEVHVGADQQVGLYPGEVWRLQDIHRQPNVNPGVFGTIRAAVALLSHGSASCGGDFQELAEALAEEYSALRKEAYRLMDEVEPHRELDYRLQIRAAALELGCRASSACIAAEGGRGLGRASRSGRLLGESHFHLVQAQTASVRRATSRTYLEVGNGRELSVSGTGRFAS